jgi:hypothetical protein
MQYASWFSILILVTLMIMPLDVPFHASASIIDRTPVPPIVYDMNGSVVQNSIVGQTVVISNNFTNNGATEIEFTLLVEVRDENGITQFIAWQSSTASHMSTKMMGVSWSPSSPGEYHIRTFPISNLTNPQVLGSVETAQHTVFIGQGNTLYKMEIDGKQYDIEYSLEGGYIENITYDLSLATTTVQVFLTKDSQLSIEFPYEVVEPIVCGAPRVPGGSDIDIEAFVDTIPATVKAIDTGESLIWQVELELGTEEVEFVGCGILR